MGSIERLIEQVEVHVGFFFLFGFRSRRGGRAAGVVAAAGAAATTAAAARGHGRELGVTFSDQFRDVLTLDFLEKGGELGIVDLRRGCVRTKRVVVSSVARLSRRAFASRRVARRSRRTSGENRLHIGLGRRFLPGELRLRVAKRESASVVVPKALAPSFAVPRRPRFRPLACPRARSRRPETNERFLSLASLERSGAPPIARPCVPSSSRARCPRALVRDRTHQQVRGDVFHRVRCACVCGELLCVRVRSREPRFCLSVMSKRRARARGGARAIRVARAVESV